MKFRNKIYLFVLLICSLLFILRTESNDETPAGVSYTYSLPCDFVWSVQNSGTTSVLNTVKAVNDNIGWAAGSGVVVKTTNGGINWTVYPTSGQINGSIFCMDAIDENTAWVSSSVFSAFIYKTSNGGINWTEVFNQPNGFIDGIQMINASTGYALGDPVSGVWTLLKTTNGGNNWVQMSSAPVQYNNEAGFNNTFSIINNNMWFATNNTQIYASTNLGLNWVSSQTPGLTYCFTLHFNNDTVGIASGAATVISTNGGIFWAPIQGTIHGTGDIFGAEGYGADNFWVIRDSNIYMTTDRGINWDVITGITTSGNLYAIDFAITGGCPSGWVVSSDGSVYSMKTVTGIKPISNHIPQEFRLEQNYPNPFNPATRIRFSVPSNEKNEKQNVKLVVYNALGSVAAVLVNEALPPGTYEAEWSIAYTSDYSSGIYFYTLTANDFIATKKMIILK